MTKENKIPSSYKYATGKATFGLTNDYMFRAVFQKNPKALEGLICSVMHLSPDDIQSVVITNPIKLGETIDSKEFILDIEILLNNSSIINLEMQMYNEYNWKERSLSYLCRNFDQLLQKQDYKEAMPVTHIGFLNYALFPQHPEFNSCFKMTNIKNHVVYSDKFTLNVINLNLTELATREDKAYKIDYWAKLFTTTEWEELKMIAEKDPYFDEATQTMYELNQDKLIEMQCRARRNYEQTVNSYNKAIIELEEAHKIIEQHTRTIKRLEKRIVELETQQK